MVANCQTESEVITEQCFDISKPDLGLGPHAIFCIIWPLYGAAKNQCVLANNY